MLRGRQLAKLVRLTSERRVLSMQVRMCILRAGPNGCGVSRDVVTLQHVNAIGSGVISQVKKVVQPLNAN